MVVAEPPTPKRDRHFYVAGFIIASTVADPQQLLLTVDGALRAYARLVNIQTAVIRPFPEAQTFDIREDELGKWCYIVVMSDKISVVDSIATLVNNRFKGQLEWMMTTRS